MSRWYGTQFLARIQRAPLACVVGSAGAPGHVLTAISPTNAASVSCSWPAALDCGVITSTSPGTSVSPFAS